MIPSAEQVADLHDDCLARADWPVAADAILAGQLAAGKPAVWQWIAANHRFNSLLWAEEDLARRTTVAAAEIAANKRAIDGFNQARNDATERVDELLLVALGLVDEA